MRIDTPAWLKRGLLALGAARARREEARLGPDVHDLAVCAIFRDEAPFLDEWLNFHYWIGARHFYLYNNFSRDDYAPVLAPWIDAGLVTLTEWPVEVGQYSAYRDCAWRRRMNARRIAFIDLDEFLFSPKMVDIRPVLRAHARPPALVVDWALFGSSGNVERPAVPVTRAYTRRAPDEPRYRGAKSIANPRQVRAVRSPHLFQTWEGESRDILDRVVDPDRPWPEDFTTLRLNHYWSRSIADLKVKVARGDASRAKKRDLEGHLWFESKLNAVEDRSILPIVDQIEQLGRPF